jgi:hypothetical protein
MIVIGLEADYACVKGKAHPYCLIEFRGAWYYVELVFTLLLCVEMAGRIYSMGFVHYFRGDSISNPYGIAFMRCADFAIVFARLLDSCLFEPLEIGTPIKIISCIRILHVAEIMRRNQAMTAFREVMMIIFSFWDAVRVVVWTLIVMSVLIYVLAIVMTDQIYKAPDANQYDYSRSAWEKKPWTVEDYWGTVPRSAFSLFQVVTLDNWSSTLIRPLVRKHPAFIFLIIPFLVIAVLGLLNVIVAVIVECVIAAAAVNEEKISKEREKMHTKVLNSLQAIFEDADLDKSGDLDREELEKALTEQHIRDRLNLLNFDLKDIYALFDMLDETGDGVVPNEKFFRGCARLQGEAMSCDLNHLQVDFARYTRWCQDLSGAQKDLNHTLHNLVADIEGMDRDILKSDHDAKDPVLLDRRQRHKDPRHLDNIAKMSVASSGTRSQGTRLPLPDDSEGESEVYDPRDEVRLSERMGSKTSRTSSKRSSLVMASIQNQDNYDEMVAITNKVRDEHGIERHHSHREDYDNAAQQFYQNNPSQAKKNEKALQDTNKMLGLEDANPKIRMRR